MGIGAIGYNTEYYRANASLGRRGAVDGNSNFLTVGSYSDLFSETVQNFKDANQLTAQELKEDRDWREMSDEEWEKVLEDVDEYIDAFKEQLKKKKEMQEETAQKAAMEADSDMKTTAASSAALGVVANGLGCTAEGDAEDGADYEKNWTKNLKTDDQTILRTAQVAQDMEKMAMSKLQEVQLTDRTVVGISRSENVTECASVEEDENKEKIWTITAFVEVEKSVFWEVVKVTLILLCGFVYISYPNRV